MPIELKGNYQDPGSLDEALAEDIQNYYNLFDVSCEFCNSKDWHIIRGPDNLAAVSMILKPDIVREPGYDFAVYPYVCIDCGNTKFISKFIAKYELRKYKNKLTPEGGADE